MRNRQILGTLALAFAISAGTVELDPNVAAKLSTETITLRGKMKADVAYNVICEAAGIDVIFAPSVEPPQMWLHLNDVTLGQALEIVRRESRTAWRPVAPHMIAVVPVPPPKLSTVRICFLALKAGEAAGWASGRFQTGILSGHQKAVRRLPGASVV